MLSEEERRRATEKGKQTHGGAGAGGPSNGAGGNGSSRGGSGVGAGDSTTTSVTVVTKSVYKSRKKKILRNRIGYEKLHKLVYMHYNLKLCIQQFEADFHSRQEKDTDPCSVMMDVALYDEGNPIMEWLSNSMSGSTPTLDEYDDEEEDWTAPDSFLIEELEMEVEEVAAFKRKLNFGKKDSKKRKMRQLDDDEEEGFLDDFE
ncbi:hypothetical protein EJB05_33005, partial [Eragrostis curvula]